MKHDYRIIERVRPLIKFVKETCWDNLTARVYFFIILSMVGGSFILTGGKGFKSNSSVNQVWLKCSDKLPYGEVNKKLPYSEINKIYFRKHDLVKDRLEGRSLPFLNLKNGTQLLVVFNTTDWDIRSIAVLFDINYMNGSSQSVVLINEFVKIDENMINNELVRSLRFIINDEDVIKYFTDMKILNMRVVEACGKIRPMKIEIKIDEALKEAVESTSKSINKIKKDINDLFSR